MRPSVVGLNIRFRFSEKTMWVQMDFCSDGCATGRFLGSISRMVALFIRMATYGSSKTIFRIGRQRYGTYRRSIVPIRQVADPINMKDILICYASRCRHFQLRKSKSHGIGHEIQMDSHTPHFFLYFYFFGVSLSFVLFGRKNKKKTHLCRWTQNGAIQFRCDL